MKSNDIFSNRNNFSHLQIYRLYLARSKVSKYCTRSKEPPWLYFLKQNNNILFKKVFVPVKNYLHTKYVFLDGLSWQGRKYKEKKL